MESAETDAVALRQSKNLVDFLATLTDASTKNPVRDSMARAPKAPNPLIWLGELPPGIEVTTNGPDLLEVDPPRKTARPAVPDELADRLDTERIDDIEGDGPELLHPLGDSEQDRDEIPTSIRRAHRKYLERWRSWAADERTAQQRSHLYDQLERVANTLESNDDEYEFVLATGLVTWAAPGGHTLRRHLLTEPVRATRDRETARITVSTGSGENRRLEERELLDGRPEYAAERARASKSPLLDTETTLLSDDLADELHTWLANAMKTPVECHADWQPPRAEPTNLLTLTTAPALLMRPRGKDKEAEAYRTISAELQNSTEVPAALAPLVVEVEAEQRDRWLTQQGASRGDVLGTDPLFPLSANDTQSRVLDMLRTENRVVVQGPPGTGKTHTIANLISALLARGQRVLVTSQKDQALRVLREKIPDELRQLCVLLAGGSKDASIELQRSLDALSESVAETDVATLARKAENLAHERDALKRRSAELNNEIRELRSVEQTEHPPVVPDYRTDRYSGTLSTIVNEVQRGLEQHSWMPPVPDHTPGVPPFPAEQFLELRALSAQDTPERRARAEQWIPETDNLPTPADLAKLVHAEQEAARDAEHATGPRAQTMADLGHQDLTDLAHLAEENEQALHECQLESTSAVPEWVTRAAHDRLTGTNTGLWSHLVGLAGEAERLQAALRDNGLRHHVDPPTITTDNLGTAKGWLNTGHALLGHLRNGGKLRGIMPKQVQKDAQPLLEAVRVDGTQPDTADKLQAALDRVGAEVAVVQLAEKWSDAGVDIPPGNVPQTLSTLHDNEVWLAKVSAVIAARDRIAAKLTTARVRMDLSTVEALTSTVRAVPAARRHADAEDARKRVDQLYRELAEAGDSNNACPEIANLLGPVHARDPEGYGEALSALETVREHQRDEQRRAQLARTLYQTHPRLLEVVQQAHGPEWEQRLTRIADAWAWSKAAQFVQGQRTASRERELSQEFDQVEDKVARVTAQLAAAYAMRECLLRMSDEHVSALRTYKQHMGNVGAGTGKRAREFLRAAKDAMRKAKHAVPAWVVPLPNLLDTISAERNSFDVIIVDEASQVGLEQLYLLWMAPRIIVVGDDKQCTPQEGRLGKQDEVFSRMGEYLSGIDRDIRDNLTGKSNLYGLLSARSGKDSVIRLREHFRCMPEIIHWSSTQFYGTGNGKPGLVPLRQIEPDRLEPLRVTQLADGYTEGTTEKLRNLPEAKRIVATLLDCLNDPNYDGKTFGVVVLQGTQQVALIEHEINAAISPETRQERRIRVGNAANFQGDERDVVLLSMVIADRPKAIRAEPYRQAYNVAASRAKDQLWLFTSVGPDQLPDDLRSSLLTYMQNPPSQYGESPDLDHVPERELREPFDSIFEQQVFREIKKHDYHVVPQFELGSRTLDLVVVGERGRIAVECDGHRFHASPEQQISDARRDRELHRMRWETVRVRESEFHFDREREMNRLWQRFDELGITPHSASEAHQDQQDEPPTSWQPIDLGDNVEGEQE